MTLCVYVTRIYDIYINGIDYYGVHWCIVGLIEVLHAINLCMEHGCTVISYVIALQVHAVNADYITNT